MAARSLGERVEILEQRVEVLQELPARVAAVESQILQLRGEMHVEFSAIREDLGRRIQQGDEETRREARALHEEVLSRIDDTNRSMRVLHEDVVARISLVNDGGRRRKR